MAAEESLMEPLSQPVTERSRKAHSMVLQSMQEAGTARTVAHAMGASESTVSRIKTEKLEDSITLLYHLGFKVVPQDRVCVDVDTYTAMSTIARKAMSCPETTRRLIWDGDA